jgi:acyl carrier protein
VLEGDVRILDREGRLVAEALGLQLRIVSLIGPESAGTPPAAVTPEIGARPLLDTLQAMPPEERRTRVETYLRAQVARVLALPEARIEARHPLLELGLDSLMAIEIRNRIEVDLGVVVPITTFLQNPSIAQLVMHCLPPLDPGSQPGEDSPDLEELVL